MQQMLKSMAGPGGPGGPGGNPFGGAGGNPFAGMPMPPPGAGFPFPMPPSPSPSPVSAAAAAPPVDVAPTAVTSSQPSAKSEVTSGPAEARKSGKRWLLDFVVSRFVVTSTHTLLLYQSVALQQAIV